MSGIRDDFLSAARSAAALLRDPAVTAAWEEPSALPEFGVGALAGHMVNQILLVPRLLEDPVPEEPVVSLVDHYGRSLWVDAGLDDEVNVTIRLGGEQIAAEGPRALAEHVDSVVEELAVRLPSAPERPVRFPWWGPWSLTFDDALVTRTVELVVHSDDLAVSVGVPTPPLPESVVDRVIVLLSKVAARRHGPTAVLRALSRAERAPSNITAF
ncbi:maleylpyruvate isomerase N-terminal domain-containing protein [Streptosporangium sp. NPDC000239]|uniref:Maleylpyruvate isomerase N-terminal domain-containing protein n=1 Tax=Streptosporangium jomthongense TaxID=1193683 RepID=A0ABV8ESS2_9ACTN